MYIYHWINYNPNSKYEKYQQKKIIKTNIILRKKKRNFSRTIYNCIVMYNL